MGTKVHCESYLQGFCSMRDLNEDSSSCSWPLFYGDKPTPVVQYNNGYMQRTSADGHQEHEKDALKQKMLEHEAVFKNQVCELHRLYQIQRNMMEEAKRRELSSFRPSMEPASSSCLQGPQEAAKWHMAGFPMMNSFNGRTSGSLPENTSSPVSYTWGYRAELNHFPLHNGPITKESVTLDGRPLKVRKTFDLQLPARDCVSIEDVKYTENTGPASGTKLFLDCAGVKVACAKDVSASCVRVSTELVDLNKPIQIEETTTTPSPIDFLHLNPENGENKGLNQPAKSKIASFDVNSFHLSNGYLINSSVGSEVHNRGRLSHTYDAGSSSRSIASNLRHGMLNPIQKPPGIHPDPYSKEDDRWREGVRCGLGPSNRDHDRSNNSQVQYAVSHKPSSFPFLSSSAGSRALSLSSWAKPLGGNFAQKITTTSETNVSSAAAVSAPCQEHFVRKLFVNSSSRLNPDLHGESVANGFYQGSASASKEPRLNSMSSGYGFPNCNRFDNVASQRSRNLGIDIPYGSSLSQSSKSAVVIDLNDEIQTSDEVVILEDLNAKTGRCEPEDRVPAFPWLKPKVEPMNVADASSSKLCYMNEMTREKEIVRRAQDELSMAATTSVVNDCNPEGQSANCTKKPGMIDINADCEPDEERVAEPTVEKKKQKKCAFIRDYIDLNAFASDEDDDSGPCDERPSTSTKRTLEIDLEAPVLQESEEDSVLPEGRKANDQPMPSYENRNKQTQDEVLRDAADIMVVISSSCPQMPPFADTGHASKDSSSELLRLFADAVLLSVCELGHRSTNGKESRRMQRHSATAMDEFEAMTLQLEATKEEDYMPKPILLEFQNVEEDPGVNGLINRPRRGQPRRGRQRRDFQRDILPGLTSLSRHEVTEDLQIFGGLMRAMGHTWNSGLTRRNSSRNGGGRGRKRSVVETAPPPAAKPVCTSIMRQFSSIETGLEDTSLTGWGKTTRRPRRQRFPAVNPPSVVLS